MVAIPQQGQERLRVGKSFNPREVSQIEATGFAADMADMAVSENRT